MIALMGGFTMAAAEPIPFLEVNIEGDRVRLVPTVTGHAEAIFREFTPEIARYMYPKPAERIEETLEFVESSRRRMNAGANLQLTIVARESGEFLGCCGLHGEGRPKTPELGIWLKRAAHGRGYGREAIATLVAWVSAHLIIDHFEYPADRRNQASRKIAEALGGTIVGEKADVGHGGNPLDLVIYRIEPIESQ